MIDNVTPNSALGADNLTTTALNFAGLIDDFRLYDGILSPATIKTIATARGADGITEGLLHRYTLNDLVPGSAVVGVACIAAAERIVGLPLGTPTFAAGITVSRHRRRPAIGRR